VTVGWSKKKWRLNVILLLPWKIQCGFEKGTACDLFDKGTEGNEVEAISDIIHRGKALSRIGIITY
jgi:hypothetical protein